MNHSRFERYPLLDKRAIQERIENPLAKQILEGRFAAKDKIMVDAKRGQLSFDKA